ncbi:hypothetical protein LCGC14_1696270 [marine sediment metagenome]|uniref:Uncharacterized protein n=1 Tax=marine sediment metagenome TaxID=412755 RepID=A0A0F9KJB7_9ZZZZ
MFKRAVYMVMALILIFAVVAIASEQVVTMEIKGMTCGL